jgi:hypothetical protein
MLHPRRQIPYFFPLDSLSPLLRPHINSVEKDIIIGYINQREIVVYQSTGTVDKI